ncbi:MAG: autotransporter domain-containing protein [Granulosicoccaceae bacterium]
MAEEQAMPALKDLPRQFQMLINLGSAGLLTEMANFENMSVTQGRLGISRAQVELSRASGLTQGFKDTTEARVFPADALISLPKGQGKSFVRVGVIAADYDADKGDLVEVDTKLQRVELQYMYSPSLDSLYGIGVHYEKAEMDLVHMGGTLHRPGYGLRADALNKLSPHWGLATRLDYNLATNENTLPVGPGAVLSYDLDDKRLYIQSDLVGTYGKQSLGFLPENWIFRPALGVVYQHTAYDTATTNFGSTATGTAGRNEEYAFASLSARLERTTFGPKIVTPHVEIGLEKELKNELNTLVDDDNIFHLDIGAATAIGRGARLDLIYTAHKGSKDLRQDQALSIHFGLAF